MANPRSGLDVQPLSGQAGWGLLKRIVSSETVWSITWTDIGWEFFQQGRKHDAKFSRYRSRASR